VQGNSRLGSGKGVRTGFCSERRRFAPIAILLAALVLLSPVAYGADNLVTGGNNVGARLFFPADITINMNDRVNWTRDPSLGFEDHSSSSGTCDPPPSLNCVFGPTGPGGVSWGGVLGGPGGFFLLVISPAVTEFRTFHFAGDYPYFCAVHPDVMRGIIRVNKANTTTTISRTAGTNPSTFGQSVTFQVNVNSSAPLASAAVVGAPTGTVTLRSNGTPVIIVSVSPVAGTNNLQSRATIPVTVLPVGTNQVIDAVYSSDANFNGSTTPPPPAPQLTHTVNKATPTVGVTNPTNPSTFGQQVTFTATANGPAAAASAPLGNVTFRDGLTTLATVALSASGQPAGQAIATHSISSLVVGTHDIRADYIGDTNFNAVNNTALSPGQQVVGKGDPTITVASSDPGGQFATKTVTFTAVVSGAATPTGTVTFFDGVTAIPGDAALSGGVANKDVTTLSGGSHTISATYNGDANFNTKTGNLNTNPQVIRDFSVSATPNPLSGTSGQMRSYNGTLTSLGGYGPRTVNLSCGTGAPATCTPVPSSVSVPSGGTANFTVNVLSNAAAGTSFNFNIVGTDAAAPFTVPLPLQRQQTVVYNVVNTQVDMQLTQLHHNATPDPVQLGEVVQLQALISNVTGCSPGPCPGHSVAVLISFSAPVTGIIATPSSGTCSQGTAPISCSLGDIANAATRTITLTFPAPRVRQLTVSASVSSNDSDTNVGDNSLNSTFNIRLRPWLRIPLKLP
jgi:Bacterial Ig-like domain (group 3)/Domain of unknown function DUF11